MKPEEYFKNHKQIELFWTLLIDSVSHELTTPLSIVRMIGNNVEKVSPALLDGYKLAINNKLLEPKFNENSLKTIAEHSIPSLKTNVTSMIDFLSLVHQYTHALIHPSVSLDVRHCLQTLLKNYPYENDADRNLVHVDFPDAMKSDIPLLFISTLFEQLLNNAIRAIHQAGKGEIMISAKHEEEHNVVHFQDTATGMSPELQEKVFSRFFSKRNGNIIPALGFCKLALLVKGGDILCETKEGEFTKFSILFPQPHKKAGE